MIERAKARKRLMSQSRSKMAMHLGGGREREIQNWKKSRGDVLEMLNLMIAILHL